MFSCGALRTADEGDEIEAALSQTPAIRDLAGDLNAVETTHVFRLRFPRFYPGAPLEAWLERPVFHPNVDPNNGFVCLWTRTSVGDTAVEAVRRLHKILRLEIFNAEADQRMQPTALEWLQDAANADRFPLPGAPFRALGVELVRPTRPRSGRKRLEPL